MYICAVHVVTELNVGMYTNVYLHDMAHQVADSGSLQVDHRLSYTLLHLVDSVVAPAYRTYKLAVHVE